MSALTLLRCAHVLFAVLGTGTVAAIAIASRAASRTDATIETGLLTTLSRWASLGLLLVLLSGAGLDFLASGAFHREWWFRLSGLAIIVTGAMLARVRALLRRIKETGDAAAPLASIRASAYAACGLVAWIVVLMELRPFQ